MEPRFCAARLAALSLLGLMPAVLGAQMYGPPSSYSSPYGQPQAYGPSPYGGSSPYGGTAQPQAYGQQPYGRPGYQQPYPQQAYDQPAQPQYQPAQPQYGYGQNQPYGQPAQQSLDAAQLEQLVAPIALYPDTLVAQMLAASTYPAQVADADRWLAAQGNASPYQIAGGADVQSWDPSVKSLTAFPQVLAEMDRNQGWMAELGNVYYNQPQDVLQAVQVMRQRAQAAGTLQSSPQELVSYDQGNIELAPPSPDMVYVPQYDPWNSYGDPVTPYPGFNLLGAIGSFFSTVGPGLLHFGPGIAMAAFNHTPFGWLSWALSWLTNGITLGHSAWATQSTAVADWGLPYGGPRAFTGGGEGYHGSAFGYRGGGAGGLAPTRGYARPPSGYAGNSREVAGNRYDAAPHYYEPNRYEQNRGYGQTDNRSAQLQYLQRDNRGYEQQPARTGYQRGPQDAYNRAPAPISRPESYNNRPQAYSSNNSRAQTYDRPESRLAYGPEAYGGAQRGFAAPIETQRSFSAPTYRSPTESFGREDAYSRPGSSFKSGGSYRPEQSYKAPKSSGGGFHLFGGGGSHEMKAPKMPKPPKMSSHSSGGHSSSGHSSSHSGHHW